MGKKRVFIIHGWGGHPGEGVLGWLEQELTKRNIFVKSPAMANTDAPKIEEWVTHITRLVGDHYPDCYLVGYSLGANAILRYLATLKKGQTIPGVVFIAPALHVKGELTVEQKKIISPWIDKKLDLDTAKRRMNKSAAIFSDDDPLVPIMDTQLFRNKVNSKIIIEKGKGHFDQSENLPIALETILSFLRK